MGNLLPFFKYSAIQALWAQNKIKPYHLPINYDAELYLQAW